MRKADADAEREVHNRLPKMSHTALYGTLVALNICMAKQKHYRHHWQLYKPGERYFLRCEECNDVLELSYTLRRLVDERETVYRGLAYTAARAGREGEELSHETRAFVRDELSNIGEKIDREIRKITKDKGDTCPNVSGMLTNVAEC